MKTIDPSFSSAKAESNEEPKDFGGTEVRHQIAKLGLAIAAVQQAANEASGACWELLSAMLAVMVAIWSVLGAKLCNHRTRSQDEVSRIVQSQVNENDQGTGRREEERKLKAIGHKNQKKARGDEPASVGDGRTRDYEPVLQQGMSRDDEPDMSRRLRDCNEPSEVRVAKTAGVDGLAGWLCCGRRVSDGSLVAGQSTSPKTVGPRSVGHLCEHYCPSGCPRVDSAVGVAMEHQDGASETASSVKLAAMKVPREFGILDIWDESRYQSPPNHRKDSWIDVAMDRGWLIRAHGSERVRNFHPLHRGTPVSVEDLSTTRVTVAFDVEGNRVVIRDRWTTELGNVFEPKKAWRGWSFFELRTPMRPSYGARYVALESREDVGVAASGSNEEEVVPLASHMLTSGRAPGDGGGYRRGSAEVRGRIVAGQLPSALPPGLEPQGLPSVAEPPEDLLSDNSEWERVTACDVVG